MKKRNSLVENINRRKRAGKSRPKSRSTVSKKAYGEMQSGWPRSRKRQQATKRKATGKKSATRKKATKKRSRKRASKRSS